MPAGLKAIEDEERDSAYARIRACDPSLEGGPLEKLVSRTRRDTRRLFFVSL